jgi:hypothetical protein
MASGEQQPPGTLIRILTSPAFVEVLLKSEKKRDSEDGGENFV